MKESLEQWYKFLNEQNTQIIKVSPKKLESIFKVFHLSKKLLGNSDIEGSFTFTPRVPENPMTAEDNFTKRISLAPKINRAIYGITMEPKKEHSALKSTYYVYAGDFKNDSTDDIPTIKLNVELRRCNRDLSYVHPTSDEKRKYSNHEAWTIASFVDAYKIKKYGTKICAVIDDENKKNECRKLSDVSLFKAPAEFSKYSEELKQKFYACVPDANESREEWSLNPIGLYYIGIYHPDKDVVLVKRDVIDWLKTRK